MNVCRVTRRIVALAALGAVLSCGPENPAHPGIGQFESEGQAATVCASGSTVEGVDVSDYQGTIDWASVASSGRKFGFAKATQGTYFQATTTFPANWSGMKAAGMYRGAYHWLDGSNGGAAQADYYLAYVGQLGAAGDLPPTIDWECNDTSCGNAAAASTAQDIQVAQDFIAEIKAKTGLPTIIYTDPGFWNGIGAPSGFGNAILWIANIGVGCPDVPSPWSSWSFWQYSWTGAVPGITSGSCDLDQFNGTESQLGQLGGDGGTPPSGQGGGDGGTPPPQAGPLAQLDGNDAITLVNWPDQHVEAFVQTPAGDEEHLWTSGTGDSWMGPDKLDSGATCGSAAAFWGSPWSYPELFSPLASGSTGSLWWTSSSSSWNGYQPFGGPGLSHLSTLVWLDGHTEVFGLDPAGAVQYQDWDVATGAWSGWQSLGGSLMTGVGPIVWTKGTGEIFGTAPDGTVHHVWSGTGAGYTNGWSAWQQLGTGTMTSRPVPVSWPDGHVEVFATGGDGQLYHEAFSFSSGWPTSFQPLSPGFTIIGEPSAIMGPNGAELFARDAQGYVVQLSYGSGGWGSFSRIGSQTSQSDPFGWIRGDGNAEVFAIDASGALVAALRTGTTWGNWSTLSTGVDPCAAVIHSVGGSSGGSSGGGSTTGGGSSSGGATSGGSTGSNAGGGTSGTGTTGGTSPGVSGAGTTGGAPGPTAIRSAAGCGCSSEPGGAFSALLLLGLWSIRRRRLAR